MEQKHESLSDYKIHKKIPNNFQAHTLFLDTVLVVNAINNPFITCTWQGRLVKYKKTFWTSTTIDFEQPFCARICIDINI